MAAQSAEDARARFRAALQEKNFAQRCHELSKLGRGLRSLEPLDLEALLDGLAGDPSAEGPAFDELGRLVVAKAAGCLGYSRKLLGHTSRAVRFQAARGGLLTPSHAREAFLSPNSSRSLKKVLVGCSALACDHEVIEHVWELFGTADKELVWQLLVRATDEALLRSWLLQREEMAEWLGLLRRNPPGLPQLAKKFPQLMVDLVKRGSLKWGWHWVTQILSADPALVLRTTLLEGHRQGSGPKPACNPVVFARQDHRATVASWGWRHKAELMLEICQALTLRDQGVDFKYSDLYRLAEDLMGADSTKFHLTTIEKLEHLLSMWSLIPVALRTAEAAKEFVSFLPKHVKEHRAKDLQVLVGAFWKIISDVGRAPRKELLVGKESTFLKSFLVKLPAPLAVENFFRVLDEFDCDSPVYKYVQSELCKSDNGRHDRLMLRVFERYLQREGLSAVQAATMFQVLLADAWVMDVIQDAFNLLLLKLDNKMGAGLMASVVYKMAQLQSKSEQEGTSNPPKATLPVPVEWMRMAALSKNSPPHVSFLLHVLNTNRDSDMELLGALLGKYGPGFFWDALGHVFKGQTGLLQQASSPIDLSVFKELNVESVLAPIPEPSSDTSQPGEQPSKYFALVAELKKKTLGKDPTARAAGYTELLTVAQKERSQNQLKAFEDLMPFLVGRFAGEQEVVRSSILKELLGMQLLPFHLWTAMLPHLVELRRLCCKSNVSSADTNVWRRAGALLVEDALREWEDNIEPTAACVFGMEVATGLGLPAVFVQLHKKCEEGKTLSDAAARWVFETAVPLDDEGSVSGLWTTLKTLAEVVPAGKGAERALWERWPFVPERWRALLSPGVTQKAMRFILVGIVELLTDRREDLAKRNASGQVEQLWWVPLECDEYRAAVSKFLGQMESGELPAKEASSLLAERVGALAKQEQQDNSKWKVRGRRRRERRENAGTVPTAWVAEQLWDVPRHHKYTPVPWESCRCRDAIAADELRTLSKLFTSGKAQRQVLWQIVAVEALLSGPIICELVGEAIASLDARFEGMARCVGRHYPYLNAALTKGETQDGSSDVLTPLLELWLFDDGPRDKCVGRLMERDDAEFFLFFGTSFARHLSNARQEWLHTCLQKLHAPCIGGSFEFYHFARRGLMLHQVAQLGSASPGWRQTLQGLAAKPLRRAVRRAPAKRRMRRTKLKGAPSPAANEDGLLGSVQVHLWHAETQTEFLKKALVSTDKVVLALMPRLEHASAITQLDELLKAHPKEQTNKPPAGDVWGSEVIQAAGAYSDIKVEVERRFVELPAPWLCDAVGDTELETALVALRRADNALQALGVLGRYAGKVKRVVKESVTKLISHVGPGRARDIISYTMLPRKSGVGLQVAGLQKIAELRVPGPLELYRKAWSNGKCPRDVAGIILAKVNTAQSFSPEDARGFFDFFSQMAGQQDECIYVANLLLDQLIESPAWSLPFLPEVVSKLAMLPGMAAKAVSALQCCTTHVTEVLRALTEVLRAARIAARVQSLASREGPEAQTLKELKSLVAFDRVHKLSNSLLRLQLYQCEATALLGFVGEVLHRWRDAARARDGHADSLLGGALALWVKLLHPGEVTTWPDVLASMEARLVKQVGGKKVVACACRPQDLQALAQVVASHIPCLVLSLDERAQALAVAGDFFLRLLDDHLRDDAGEKADGADGEFEEEVKVRRRVVDDVLVKSWAGLLAHGCPETESSRLFARCPVKLRVKLATKVVEVAVEEATKLRAALTEMPTEWRQKRPELGWTRDTGSAVKDVKVGSTVDGVVTNSSALHGVFINFGCVRDGRLHVPEADWKKYHVGDEVRGMVVNRVDMKENNDFIELVLTGDSGAKAGNADLDVARRAVAWLAVPAEHRKKHFVTLARLWASVVAFEPNGASFDATLALLGEPAPTPEQSVRLVEELLDRKPAKSVARSALAWLGKVAPVDAVQHWPALLAPEAEVADVEALLSLCQAHGCELPVLPEPVARGISEEVLGVLAASSLPEARLAVVQALGQQHHSFAELPSVLSELREDSCEVVRVAARNLWSGLENSLDKGVNAANEEVTLDSGKPSKPPVVVESKKAVPEASLDLADSWDADASGWEEAAPDPWVFDMPPVDTWEPADIDDLRDLYRPGWRLDEYDLENFSLF